MPLVSLNVTITIMTGPNERVDVLMQGRSKLTIRELSTVQILPFRNRNIYLDGGYCDGPDYVRRLFVPITIDYGFGTTGIRG